MNLDTAKKIVAGNDAFKHKVVTNDDGVKLHSFSYDLAGYGDFADPLKNGVDTAWPLRGLTFVEYPNGTVERFRFFDKFFGFNETKGWMENDFKGWKIVSVSEKLDGSLARFFPVNGELTAKTKHDFRGPFAQLAQQLLDDNPVLTNFVKATADIVHITKHHPASRIAPIFELMNHQIVVTGQTDGLRVIQFVREEDGVVVPVHQYLDVVNTYGVPFAEQIDVRDVTIDTLKVWQETKKGTEGWVVVFEKEGKQRVAKFKTRWYENLHDLTFEGRFSPAVILEAIIRGNIDDALPRIRNEETRATINKMIDVVVHGFNAEVKETLSMLASAKEASGIGSQYAALDAAKMNADFAAFRKAYAAANNNHPLFKGRMMNLNATGLSEEDVINNIKKTIIARGAKDGDAMTLMKFFAAQAGVTL